MSRSVHLFRAIKGRIGPWFLQSVLPLARRHDLRRLGTGYGSWIVPTELLGSGAIAYCGGVGEDISFDRALIKEFGCLVWAMDPTPRAVAFVEKTAAGLPNFHFLPIGLWSTDSLQRFYTPQNPNHVSHSVVNLQRTQSFFEAECRRISGIADDLGHEHITLIKLDIEGAEYEVVESMLEDGLLPTVLCVEFDQPTPIRRVLRMLTRLREVGYSVVAVDGWNITLVASDEAH